eukprot:gene23792-9354_t
MEDDNTNIEVVEFGWNEEEKAQLSGRRLKKKKELKKKMKTGTFESMGLQINVLRAIKRKGYRLPTPIQRRAMPLVMQGMDVVGMARTGSGKTAAFVIPMIERLKTHSPRAGARAALLAPTRELALQTNKSVRELCRYTDLRTAVLVGGDAMEAQFAELAQNPDILVATPEGMTLRTIEYVVFDEADRMFEMGFAEQVAALISKMPDTRQTLLFSATLPTSLADLAEFAQAGLQNPQLVRLDAESRISPELKMQFFTLREEDKLGALMYLLREVVAKDESTIMFVATRHHVEYLHNLMNIENIPAACVFGSMDQTVRKIHVAKFRAKETVRKIHVAKTARKIHVAKFRAKKVNLLITTDVAARGIDIPLIDNVINLDFPPKPELFVHRVGRAARAGRSGTAYSLLTKDELSFLLDLHLYLGRQVVLDPILEHLKDVQEAVPELASAKTSITNAYALYIRTRPPASPESSKRAKGMSQGGVHPLLLQSMPKTRYNNLKNEVALAEFTRHLRSFRPAATVLEAEIASVKSTFAHALLESSHYRTKSTDVMVQKRLLHNRVIDREKDRRARSSRDAASAADGPASTSKPSKKRKANGGGGEDEGDAGSGGMDDETDGGSAEGEESEDEEQTAKRKMAREAAIKSAAFGDGILNEGKYRISEFFISRVKDGPDDGTNVDESFKMEQAHAEMQAAVLNLTAEDNAGKPMLIFMQFIESAKAGQGRGLYQKWVKASHQKIAVAGTEETGPAAKDLGKRFDKGMRHTSWKIKPSGGNLGLKSKDEVVRERAKTEKRKEHLTKRAQENVAGEGEVVAVGVVTGTGTLGT